MKVKTKIRSLVLLALAFCLSLIFGIVTVKTVNHKTAFGATATTAELEVSGMSLRYEDEEYKKAVRFHVTMPTDTYRKTVYAGAESGVLIIPNALLKGNELTLSTKGAQNGIFSNAKTNVWAKNSNGEYEARLVLNNIPQSNYGTKLAVRAYYTQGGVTTYSETYNTGSLAAVALMERDASDDPSNDKIQKLVEDYATFNVTINDKVFEVVYGEKAPFAGALTLTNKAGTVNWDPERAVTGNVVLKATGTSAVLEDQEIDLDINNDGTLNTTNKVAFDLSALNLSSLTYGTDYSLTAVTVGGVSYDVSGATVSGNLLQIPASVFGYIYGEKEVGLTFNYKALGIESSATATAKFISKKISNKAELDAMSTIAKACEADANTWGGYFALDSDIVYNDNLNERAGGNSSDLSKIPAKWNSNWAGTATNGFVGTFDGCGYSIDGLLVYDGGFISKIGEAGVLKNVKFTNALIGSKGNIIAGYNFGTVENVYAHVYAFGVFWGHGTDWASFAHWNPGATGANTAIINGQGWDATGTVENVFVDMTESAKNMYLEKDKAWYQQNWTSYNVGSAIRILGLASGKAQYNGVYVVGLPNNAVDTDKIKLVHNLTRSDLLNGYADIAAFDTVYGATNSAIKAEIDTWPLWLQDLLPINVPAVQVEKQTIDLNVQVNGIKASLNETATATLDFSSVCDDLGKVMSVTYGDGIAVADVEVDGATLTFPVKQFGWAGGEEEFTVITENVKYSVPVILATKVLKTAQDIDDMNHIAKAMEANSATFGGYFTLGNDIAYNGNYIPMMDFSAGCSIPYSKLGEITFDADGYAMYHGKYLWSAWKLIQNPDPSLFACGEDKNAGKLQYNGSNVMMNNASLRSTSMGWGGNGFIGTFDGRGYTIDGMTVGDGEIQYCSFIPVLGATGVIKNVAFTNAGFNNKGTGSGFLNLMGIAGSTIENVYVQLTSIEGSSNIAATIAATDNTRSNTGVQATNVFIDTTAIGSMGSNFYAVGGSSTADAFISYENVYAAVNNATQQTNAFGKGGAVSKTNTGVYEGKQAFSDEYNANATLKAAFDETNAILNGVMDAMFLAEMTISTQEIDLGVSMVNGVATVAESAEIDVFEAADGLTEVISLTYGDAPISGATVNDSTLTLPLNIFNVATYGAGSNLVLQAKNAVGKTYIITIPTTIVTKVIYNAANLDEFGFVAAAVGNAIYGGTQGKISDGYFKLGQNIAYNGTYVAWQARGAFAPLWWDTGVAQGFAGTFDGCGYTIDGMTAGTGCKLDGTIVGNAGFIPLLHVNGVIRNVAFTNVGINNAGKSGGFVLGAGQGLVENVYVQLTSAAQFSIGAAIFGTDNTRGVSGPTMRNVFVNTTALATTHSQFYAVGGNNSDNCDENGVVYPDKTPADQKDGVIDPFGIYDGVYAVVNNATQQTNAFGKGGAVSATNTGAYVGKEAFTAEYNANATLQARFDETNEILNGVMDAMFLVEAAVSTQEINLDVSMVDGVAKATESANLDVSKAANDLAEVISLTYGGTAINGATVNGSTLTLPLESISITTYGEGKDLVLQAKNAVGKTYVITIPTTFVTKIIYDAADLDEFGFVAAAVGNAKNSRTDGFISDGYFKLGQNIAYNKTYIAWQARGGFAPLWWDFVGQTGGFAGIFDGCGYTIDGMTAGTGYKPDGTIAGYAAFIPVLNKDGVIRNVAFTNAGISNNNTSSGFLTAAGQGRIENVYIQMTSASGFTVGGVLFGTDNVRGVSGPTVRNVFVDTTAITTHYAGSPFFAVGGNSGDHYDSNGASGADGVIEPFGIYDGVYALVAINEERDYAGTAFGKGGAYAGSQNYAAYAGIEAFAATYWDDAEMKDTIDALQARFGFDLNLENYYPKEINLEETQDANLNVATDLTMAESVELDLSEAGDNLGELKSVTLTNGASAYALRSASREIEDATLEGTTLTIPTEGNISATEYGKYDLTIKTTKNIINVPVSILSKVITTKEELDGFGAIALAIGGGNGVYDGYFKLGADIEYNETVKVNTAGNVWNPLFGIGAAGDLPFTTYDSLNKVTGFQGVFDGDGYSIHGWRSHFKSGWYTNGFITKVAEEGIIRNVAFTDVVNGGMSSVITAHNDGLIENVYVHYYTNGAWVGKTGSFVEYNEGWTSEATVTFNGANENATGTIRNVVVDMSESAKLNYTDGNTSSSYGLSWLDDPQTVYPLGRAVNATYEGVYAIGIPDSHAYVMAESMKKSNLSWFESFAEFIDAYDKNNVLKEIVNKFSPSFWKVVDGIPMQRYANDPFTREIRLNASVADGAIVIGNETAEIMLSETDTQFGAFVSAHFNGVDLGASYENGKLTIDTTKFGKAYGEQDITVIFTDEKDQEQSFTVRVLLVSKGITTKDELIGMNALMSAYYDEATNTYGGYFVLDNDVTCNETFTEMLSGGKYSVWTPAFTGMDTNGFVGTFDGQGHTISGLLSAQASTIQAFITEIGEGGTVKNVAFLNAVAGGQGSIVSAENNGLIENVYIHFAAYGVRASATAFENYNTGWTGSSAAAFNGGSWNAKGEIKNVFIDMTDSAKTCNLEGCGGFGLTWHNSTGVVPLGNPSTNNKYQGVYAIGIPDAITSPVKNEARGDLFDWYANEAAFGAAYNANGSAMKAEVSTWPEWLKNYALANVETPDVENYFANGGESEYVIVVGESNLGYKMDKALYNAALFIQEQVYAATGAKLAIKDEYNYNEEQKSIVLCNAELFDAAGLSLNGEHTYGVFRNGNNVFIMADNASDYQVAVLKALELLIGYRAYSMSGVGSSTATLTDGTKMQDTDFAGFIEYLNVGENGTVQLPAFASYSNAGVFEYRSNGAWNLANADGLYSMGNSVFKENYGEWHNTFKFVDPAVAHTVNGRTYSAWESTATHSWYATGTDKNGKNYTEPYQLCYTAHGNATAYSDLVAYIGGQLIATANAHPEYEIFNFTQQDNSYACQCNTCTAKGMPSDTFLAFLDDLLAYVNSEANGLTRSPIKIAYFAYNAYLPAPTSYDYDKNKAGQQLNPNTYLVLAPIGAYYDEAMNEGTNATANAWVSGSGNSAWNSDWSDVAAWLTMTKNSGVKVYLWTYEINQYAWFTARDSFEAQIANYKLFANYSNIEVMATEHLWHNANVSAFGQLKAYMNSKAMMDPDGVTYDGLVNEFFGRNADGTFTGKGYYGPAGEYMYKMYTEMREQLENFDSSMPNGKGKPYYAKELSWSESTLKTWLGYIDSAYSAVEGHANAEIYKEHILIESMMPRYLYASVYSNGFMGMGAWSGYKSYINHATGSNYASIKEFRTQFLTDAKAFGYVRFASGATDTSMYWLEKEWLSSNTVYTVAPNTYY